MDDAIPAVVELVFDKACDYVQIDNLPLTPGHVKKRLKHFFSGWHVTLSVAIFLATGVLITNLVLLLWSWLRNRDPSASEGFLLYEGDCNRMQTIFTWSHVGINILSTMLLAASNSACQVLSAPTRKEVDAAHSRGVWLDVGVSSFRNLRHISPRRVVVYILLGLSSVPLHLIYNSVIFPTTSTFNNLVAIVDERFLIQGSPWDSDGNGATIGGYVGGRSAKNTLNDMQQRATEHSLVRLSNSACIQQFSSQFVTQYSDFLIVVHSRTPSNANNSLLQWQVKQPLGGAPSGLSWLCMHRWKKYGCESLQIQNDPQGLVFYPYDKSGHLDVSTGGYTAKYCLAKPVQARCNIGMSPSLLGAVIACNFVKLICFILVVKWSDDKPMVTVGDSISSFLRSPDLTTQDMGPLSAVNVRRQAWGKDSGLRVHENVKPWKAKRHRWFVASGWKRWVVTLTCYLTFYIPSLILPWAATTVSGMGSFQNIGNINPNLIVPFTQGWSLTTNVLFVNLPQLIVSFCYLFYNNVLTSSLLASEYGDFGKTRKPLRVTSNSKTQRSTYWLQIPYRYAIPLMVAWILLHWLISQSMFLARINTYADFDKKHKPYMTEAVDACGFSPIPVLLVVILAGVLILALFLMGFRRYPDNVPVVATCTAAIAAACHASAHEGEDMVEKPLMYGVLRSSKKQSNGEKVRQVGFSAEDVEPLVKGEVYR